LKEPTGKKQSAVEKPPKILSRKRGGPSLVAFLVKSRRSEGMGWESTRGKMGR